MIDDLLASYLKFYSANNRLFKHLSRWVVYPTLIVITILISMMIVLISSKDMLWLRPLLSLPLGLILPALYFEKKRIIKDVHNFKTEKEFYYDLEQKFKDSLPKLSLDFKNRKQLEYMLDILNTEIEEAKPAYFIRNGIMITIIAPLWISYCNKLFEYTNSIESATVVFCGVVFIILLFGIMAYGLKVTFYDEVKYSRYKNLISIREKFQRYYLVSMNSKLTEIA